MSWKAETYSSIPHFARRPFLREVLGFLQFVFAALVFLALLSDRLGEQWIGRLGGLVAAASTFLLGEYAPFLVPAMLATVAWNMGFGPVEPARPHRASMRLAGALSLLLSASALLTLHARMSADSDAAAAFRAGGLIGSFVVEPEGLNVAAMLGRPGALVILYATALVGLVLFTETLAREAGRKTLRAAQALMLPDRWMKPIALLAAPAWEAARRLRLPSVRAYLEARQTYRPREGGRVLGPPVLELRPYDRDDLDPRSPREDVQEVEWESELREIRELDGPPRRGIDPPAGHEPPRASFRSRAAEEIARSSNRVFRPPSAPAPAPPAPPARRDDTVPAPIKTQPEFDFGRDPSFPRHDYVFPPLDILQPPPSGLHRMSDDERRHLSTKIEETLRQFKIDVEVVEVLEGPTITRFALQIAPGIRVSKILALENDLALALRAPQVRVLAPIPGQAAVGIEVPNRASNPVVLRELLESDEFRRGRSPLTFALGKNIAGEPVVADLAQMPHLLIAGATGAGKSVCLNTIIASLLFRNPPDRVKLVMVDPKRVELSVYQAIPHLLAPVVCDPRKAASALAWTVEQMEERYKRLAEIGVRNIDGYNQVVADRQPNRKAMGRDLRYMPHIVVIIDELADLMMVAKNEVEEYIIRLAQMARAVGIHLILATQRPSVNVITGIIKANFPSRIAFRVSSKVDSRTILDMNGAQALLGRGDMLYSPGGVKPFRLQGAFVSDDEIERLADHIRAQEKALYAKTDFEDPRDAARGKPGRAASAPRAESRFADARADEDDEARAFDDDDRYDDAPSGFPRASAGRAASIPPPPGDLESLDDEELYAVALRLVLESRKASVSYIQRRLKIGYARAGRLMDMMEERGIVGPYQGSKPRDLIVDPEEYLRDSDSE